MTALAADPSSRRFFLPNIVASWTGGLGPSGASTRPWVVINPGAGPDRPHTSTAVWHSRRGNVAGNCVRDLSGDVGHSRISSCPQPPLGRVPGVDGEPLRRVTTDLSRVDQPPAPKSLTTRPVSVRLSAMSRDITVVGLAGRLSNPAEASTTLAEQGFQVQVWVTKQRRSGTNRAPGDESGAESDQTGRLSRPDQRRLTEAEVDDLVA